MSDQEITNEESISIITEMIAVAKHNYSRGGSFFFLVWGWVTVCANLGHFVLEKFIEYRYPFIVWLITIPVAIWTGWYAKRVKHKMKITTYLDYMYNHVWVAISIGIILSLVFMNQLGFNHNAIILLLSGTGVYISGRLMKFNPLLYGAVALWITTIICFLVDRVDQTLVASIGITLGYLIPGYQLRSKERE